MSASIIMHHRRSIDVTRCASHELAAALDCGASRAPSMLTVMELGEIDFEPQLQLRQHSAPVNKTAPGTPRLAHHHVRHAFGQNHKKPSGKPIISIAVLLVALVCFIALWSHEGFLFGVGHRKLMTKRPKQPAEGPARVNCAVGSYLDGSSCKKCGARLTTLEKGAVSFEMCVAPPGSFVFRNRARLCPKGTFSSSYSNAPACTPCGKGRTTESEGSKSSAACRKVVDGSSPGVTAEDVSGSAGKVTENPSGTADPATGTGTGLSSPIPSPSPLPDIAAGTVQISPLPDVFVLPPVDPQLEVHPSPEPTVASSSSSPEPAAADASTPITPHESAVVEDSPAPAAAAAASPEPETSEGSGGTSADKVTADQHAPLAGAEAQDVVESPEPAGSGQGSHSSSSSSSPAPAAASPKPAKNLLDIPVYAQPIEDLNHLP